MYIPGEIISDLAADTVQNLRDKASLFRWGIAADILTFAIEIVLISMLYQIFRGVNDTQATIATYARFAMIVVMGINLLVYLTPLLILENADLGGAFEPEQINSLLELFFDIHAAGILVWGIFFGIHLIFLGLLVQQSPQHPTLLGWLMLVGSLGYILESVNEFCCLESSLKWSYSKTCMFFSLQIRFNSSGQMETVTSPRCAVLSRYM
jgi:hypothetical protein